MKLYHGTLQSTLKSIKKSGMLTFGDGFYGYNGVFLSKNPATAKMWARWNWNNTYGNIDTEKDQDPPVILEINLPKDHSKFLYPDFNQVDDVFHRDPKTGKEEEIYAFNRKWDDPIVSDVIYNNCANPVAQRGIDLNINDKKCGIPTHFVSVCTDRNCKHAKKL